MHWGELFARRALVVLIGLAALFPARRAAAEETRVGVVDAVQVNVTPEESLEISRALGDALSTELEVDVVAGKEARAKLPPEGLPEGCVTQAKCLKDIGTRLDVDEVLALVIVRVGEVIRVDVTFAKSDTGEPEGRSSVTLNQGVEHAQAIFADSARRLLPEATPRPKTDETAETGGTGGTTGAGNAGGAGDTGGSGTEGTGGAGQGEPGGGAIGITAGGPSGPSAGQPVGRHMTGASWVLGTAGGVMTLAAAGVGLTYSRRRHNDPDCLDGSACGDRLKRVNLLLDIAGGVGVVAVGAATVLYFLSGSGGEEAPRSFALGPGPGTVGLSFEGAF